MSDKPIDPSKLTEAERLRLARAALAAFEAFERASAAVKKADAVKKQG